MQRQKFVKGFVKTKKFINPASSESSPSSSKTPTTCSCHGRLHPLSLKTPNCLNCGFILCVENVTGFCPFCKTPLVVSAAIQEDPEFQSANKNLARLLSYQRSGAVRTMIHDEVADFQTGGSGARTVGQWGTKEEQARQREIEAKQWKKNEKKEMKRNGRGSKRMAFDIGLNRMVEVDDSSSSEEEPEKEDIVYGYDNRFTDGQGHKKGEALQSSDYSNDSNADPEINKYQKHHKKQLIIPRYINTSNGTETNGTNKTEQNELRLQTGNDYANDMALEF